jgi:D-alanyl-D-alanine carboxypeptidase (penicillin-binding protein 5/6)
MKRYWKKGVSLILAISMFVCGVVWTGASDGSDVLEDVLAEESIGMDFDCIGAILMDAATGTVFYEKNADEALPPASVTKIMTLLLVMEAIEDGKIKLSDTVSVSGNAASMGGSQVYLEEGEQMSVEDMIKSVVIASANDAACALAEFVAGSEEEFVKAMNTRAKELGMTSAVFENTNGLDDTAENHVISARDIAIMSSKLIEYEKILEYSSIWMDTVRNGEFGLTNTNRLVRYYNGCTGLKTGSTSKAGFCISATAERNGLSLVCVIMGAETRDIRNAAATRLLDWGFANYAVYTKAGEEIEGISVTGGTQNTIKAKYNDFSCIVDKSLASKIEYNAELNESVVAPVKEGDKIGDVIFTCNGKEIGRADIIAAEDVKRIGYFDVWLRMLGKYLLK